MPCPALVEGRGFCYFTYMVKKFEFGKQEKLKSHRHIDELFAKGKRFAVFPISVSYVFFEGDHPIHLKTGVTAAKKNFKKAVDRNRIKRLLREAYRIQKNELIELMKQRKIGGHVFFIYTDKTLPTFSSIQQAMLICLQRLQQKLPS